MQLENLLSEVKASVPKGKQTAYGEKTAYLSHLSQLMKQHLQRGRRDLRGCQRQDELLEMGVPLARRSRSGVFRHDMRWKKMKFYDWKLHHPGASDEEMTRQRQHFVEMFAAFSDLERAAAIASLPAFVTEACAAEQDDSGPEHGDDLDFNIDLFDFGNGDWPLRDEVLASFVHGHPSHASEGFAGIANKASGIRRDETGALIIMDKGVALQQLKRTDVGGICFPLIVCWAFPLW
jgi:hypothetical protein